MTEKGYLFEDDFFEILCKADEEAKRKQCPFVPSILVIKKLYQEEYSLTRTLFEFMGLPEDIVLKTMDKLIDKSIEDNQCMEVAIFEYAKMITICQDGIIEEIDFLTSLVDNGEIGFYALLRVFNKNVNDVAIYLKGRRSFEVERIDSQGCYS